MQILREEAQEQGTSVNALANRIFQNYCQHWRWAERFGSVFVTRQTVSDIISCCPKEKIIQIAKKSGSTGAKDALRTMGIVPTHNNILHFIKNNMGKFGNWFDFSDYKRENKEVIHLRHQLGPEWSLFIANQVSTIFETILKKKTTIEVGDNFATIQIP